MKTINIHIIKLLTAALFVAMVLTGCKDRESIANTEGTSNGPAAIPVTVVEIKPVAMRDVVFLPGETEAYEDVKVAANTSGRVEWIGLGEGQAVKKGDRLAKIDVSALKASLEHARAA